MVDWLALDEADSTAEYLVEEDGSLLTGGYAGGESLKDLRMYELAYLLEFGITGDKEENSSTQTLNDIREMIEDED